MKPNFSIAMDGKNISSILQQRLISLSVADESERISDTVTIQLSMRDLEIPKTGKTITIAMGRDDDLFPMGQFIIDEVILSGPPSLLTLRGHGATFKSSLTSERTESYTKTTLGKLIEKVASRHHLTTKISTVFSTLALSRIEQSGESDMHFLERLRTEHNAILKIQHGKIVFLESSDTSTLPVVTIGPKDITSYRLSVIDRMKYTSVIASWYDATDPVQKSRHKSDRPPPLLETEERNVGPSIPTSAVDVEHEFQDDNQGMENDEKVDRRWGLGSHNFSHQVKVGSGTPTHVLKWHFASKDAALQAATERLKSLKRGAKTVELVLPGRVDIMAATVLHISETDIIDGRFLVTRVDHVLDSSALTTSLSAKKL